MCGAGACLYSVLCLQRGIAHSPALSCHPPPRPWGGPTCSASSLRAQPSLNALSRRRRDAPSAPNAFSSRPARLGLHGRLCKRKGGVAGFEGAGSALQCAAERKAAVQPPPPLRSRLTLSDIVQIVAELQCTLCWARWQLPQRGERAGGARQCCIPDPLRHAALQDSQRCIRLQHLIHGQWVTFVAGFPLPAKVQPVDLDALQQLPGAKPPYHLQCKVLRRLVSRHGR